MLFRSDGRRTGYDTRRHGTRDGAHRYHRGESRRRGGGVHEPKRRGGARRQGTLRGPWKAEGRANPAWECVHSPRGRPIVPLAGCVLETIVRRVANGCQEGPGATDRMEARSWEASGREAAPYKLNKRPRHVIYREKRSYAKQRQVPWFFRRAAARRSRTALLPRAVGCGTNRQSNTAQIKASGAVFGIQQISGLDSWPGSGRFSPRLGDLALQWMPLETLEEEVCH